MKKYESIDGSTKELKIEVYYDKGGMNYFTSKVDPRGYWLSMRQVSVERRDDGVMIESFGLFSGSRMFLLEVKKQSPKSYAAAVELANGKMDEMRSSVLA